MKKILLAIALVAVSAFATSASKTHDGFFLNFALGFGYQNISYVISDYQYKTFDESGAATDIDFKIGGRIMNNMLLHATCTGTTLTESFDGYNKNGHKIDYKANMSLFGIGVTYYFLENYLVTGSLGIAQFHANEDVKIFHGTVTTGFGDDINAGFGFQIGGGKEWWIADEWGIGATASILYGFASNEADTKESSFAISLRLSVTYN